MAGLGGHRRGPYGPLGPLMDPFWTTLGPPSGREGLPTGPRPRDLAGFSGFDGFGHPGMISGRCTRVLDPYFRSGQIVAARSVGFGNMVKTRFKSAGNLTVFLKLPELLKVLDRQFD